MTITKYQSKLPSQGLALNESEKGLIDFANEVIDRKGTLFIPSFSVERSQEVASVLINSGFKHKIIMDGMALKVNEVLLRYPEYLRNPEIFRNVG